MLWGLLNLGTNVAMLRVPVTYRDHIKLHDPWRLHVADSRVIVEAPPIRAGFPPAIRSDELVSHVIRGWSPLHTPC